MKYVFRKVKDKTDRKLFLNFPSKLYTNYDNPQDYLCEKQLIDGNHILSDSFKFTPFLVLNNSGEVLCRCAVTIYPDDKTAYVGFFESINDVSVVRFMFQHIKRFVFGKGCREMIGPIDASIYINYRFKASHFNKTYTSEPYNKPYYVDLWEKCGFKISEKYVSNQLRKVKSIDIDKRLEKISNKFQEKGYIFTSPTDETFQKNLIDVYHLMMKTYSGFPCFKKISGKQFLVLYSKLSKIANYDMIKLVYKDGLLKAFCVCIPNYRYLTRGKMSINKLMKIKRVKESPDEYVVLYVGADSSSVGLGSSLIHHIRNELYKNECTSIGALIKEGNLTGELYKDLYIDQYKYVLMKYKLGLN